MRNVTIEEVNNGWIVDVDMPGRDVEKRLFTADQFDLLRYFLNISGTSLLRMFSEWWRFIDMGSWFYMNRRGPRVGFTKGIGCLTLIVSVFWTVIALLLWVFL